MTDRPIAEWLVASREAQIDDATGEPWTQDRFLAELHDAIGWKLHRSNLSAYENGRQTPKAPTLAKFVRFWASKGITGPDLVAKAPPEPESLASAIRGLTEELRLLRESQSSAGAATAELVAVAIRETLRAAGIAAGLPPK